MHNFFNWFLLIVGPDLQYTHKGDRDRSITATNTRTLQYKHGANIFSIMTRIIWEKNEKYCIVSKYFKYPFPSTYNVNHWHICPKILTKNKDNTVTAGGSLTRPSSFPWFSRIGSGIVYFVSPVCLTHDPWVFTLNVLNGVPHKHSKLFDCVCKQVTSFLGCIKVSSLLAPQENQRAGGSLGRSVLPWATYQTAGMCAVGVSVCLQRASHAAKRVGGC